jgi:hypothetical protein
MQQDLTLVDRNRALGISSLDAKARRLAQRYVLASELKTELIVSVELNVSVDDTIGEFGERYLRPVSRQRQLAEEKLSRPHEAKRAAVFKLDFDARIGIFGGKTCATGDWQIDQRGFSACRGSAIDENIAIDQAEADDTDVRSCGGNRQRNAKDEEDCDHDVRRSCPHNRLLRVFYSL